MKIAFFSAQPFEAEYFKEFPSGHTFTFIHQKLDEQSAGLAKKHEGVCVFAHDTVDEATLKKLAELNVRLVIERSSGIDNIDFDAARKYNIHVRFLPGYSPEAIAEHAAALLLSLNRKTHLAYVQEKAGDFRIEELIGFNIFRKTVGIIGMGRIGYSFARIMKGFGTKILAYDVTQNEDIAAEGIEYTSLETLLTKSDIISLHCTMQPSNIYLLHADNIALMKKKPVLINTARGKLVDTRAVLNALKDGTIAAYGADVYEREAGVFYHQFNSPDEINDPLLKELLSLPTVLITPHQAYFTREALQQIARTLINELNFFEQNILPAHQQLMI